MKCILCGRNAHQGADLGTYLLRTNPLGEIGEFRCANRCGQVATPNNKIVTEFPASKLAEDLIDAQKQMESDVNQASQVPTALLGG